MRNEYPPPSYMFPTRSKMEARLENKVKHRECPSTEFRDIYDVYMGQSPDTGALAFGHPDTPRRDSTTLEHSPSATQLTDASWPSQDGYTDDIELSSLHLTKLDQTWHSVVAAWHMMKFAQRFNLDLVYVIHIHRDSGCKLSISRFHPFPSRSVPFVGEILAAYGLQNVPLPLNFSMHLRHLQEDRANGSEDLTEGQIHIFRTSRYQLYDCMGQDCLTPHDDESKQQIQRGILFAASHPVPREAAEEFVRFVSDIYLTGGLQSLVLDELPPGAKCLRTTSDLASSDGMFGYV